jgi:regulatory protein
MSESIIEFKPRPRKRVFIKFSGGRFFTVPEAEAQLLKVGMHLEVEEIERLSRIDQYCRGKDKTLRLIAIRSRTRHELKKTLEAMDLLPAIRGGILGELEEIGLIDDARFAREFVRIKVDLKRLGPHRLRFDLKKLGVGRSIIDDVLNDEFDSAKQEAMAWDLVDNKLGNRTVDEKLVRRIRSLLSRKGLDYEVVNRVTYELLTRIGRDEPID